tara:strand:- start:13868 stop:14878 length:1011 start_codon:yes stop_codon:yes gene_type:complete
MRSLLAACPIVLGLSVLHAMPAPTVNNGTPIRVTQNNIAIIEIESVAPTGDWVFENSDAGFAGTGYYRWNGPNLFNENEAGQGVLTYVVEVLEASTYVLNLHNRHDHPNDTEENDCWARLNNGPWLKLFSNGPSTIGAWTWDSRFDLAPNNQPGATFTMGRGINRIEFSGRSNNFKMDRFHLYKAPNANAVNLAAPETTCRIGTWVCDPGQANSTGQWTRATASGSTAVADQDLTLHAYHMPTNQFGFFLTSQTNSVTLNPGGSDGHLCLGGSILRFQTQLQNSGAGGHISIPIDILDLPHPYNGPILAGQTWFFQAWHRDGAASNFSNAISVTYN